MCCSVSGLRERLRALCNIEPSSQVIIDYRGTAVVQGDPRRPKLVADGHGTVYWVTVVCVHLELGVFSYVHNQSLTAFAC